jgi:pimeloyl-ACP methyl ester carboxylesterase
MIPGDCEHALCDFRQQTPQLIGPGGRLSPKVWPAAGLEPYFTAVVLAVALTYEKMTDDLAALLDHLKTGPVNVLGWSDGGIKTMVRSAPAGQQDTPQARRDHKVTGMMLEEPNIDPKALEAITAPTLVLASDHDAIRDEHTVEIYQHIPNSQLAIFPNAKHTIPFDDPRRSTPPWIGSCGRRSSRSIASATP